MTLKKSETADIGGTSCMGYIHTTYAKLVETFGEPSHNGDGYKIDAEWVLEDERGNVVTIYNYKDGVNYLGEDEGTPVEDILEWHIGANDESIIELVRDALPNEEVTKGW